MNIRQLEIFKAVMETGSVTAASARLRISQPSTSKHLKLLEADLDMPLFLRSGNRILPTEEAHALFRQLERTYQGMAQLERFAAGLKQHPAGEIAVASMPLLARSWVPEIIGRFLHQHDGLSIALPIRSTRWIADAVSTGQVDMGLGLGLTVADVPELAQKLLMRTPLVCVMPEGHELAGRPAVTPADLAGRTLITLSNFDQWRLAVETTLELGAAHPRRRVDTFTTQVACELVARGTGIAIVDLLTALDYADSGLVWCRFEPALVFDIALMHSVYRPLSRLALQLMETMQAEALATAERLERTLAGRG